MNIIPAFVRDRIAHRSNLVKIFDNIGWLFFDRMLRMGIGLLVVLWVARYLGPEQFGQLNYATSFVSLFGAFATLGLKDIAVRDMVRDPAGVNTTLGTVFAMRVIGGLVSVALIAIAIGYMRPIDDVVKTMVLIISFSLVFSSSHVIQDWYGSQVQMRYVVWVTNGVFLLIGAVKIGMILNLAPLVAFAWIALLEAIVVAVGLFGIYLFKEGMVLQHWSMSLARAKALLKDSWPLVLSGVAVMAYMRIDQIMLGQMLGDDAVGIYSAAVRVSEVWYFVPMAVVTSVYPSLIGTKGQSEALYYRRLQKLYDLMVLLALAVAVPMTFFSDSIVVLLFGTAYASAGGILSINIWAGVFVFMGIASSRWLLIEGFQKDIFYRALLGATVNVIANLLLIPAYGTTGAALATVFSYFVAAFSVFFRAETRIASLMMFRSMFFVHFFTWLRRV